MKQSPVEVIKIMTKSLVEPYVDTAGHFWYFKGSLHRENGHAIEWANGTKSWFLNGKRHRIDGPAVEAVDGFKAWWLNDYEVEFREWKQEVRKYYDTEEDYLLMLLKL